MNQQKMGVNQTKIGVNNVHADVMPMELLTFLAYVCAKVPFGH